MEWLRSALRLFGEQEVNTLANFLSWPSVERYLLHHLPDKFGRLLRPFEQVAHGIEESLVYVYHVEGDYLTSAPTLIILNGGAR